MNDTYAALFIVAAVTLFAAIWTGAWRWRGAFWVGMPFVGVLLGLGLASKWVALYAQRGDRPAHPGPVRARARVVVVLGLAAATAVLGYMAVSVPSGDTAGGNLAFLAIMIGPDARRRAAVTVLHPIAWTVEEVQVAVAGPAGVGALVALAAIPLHLGTTGPGPLPWDASASRRSPRAPSGSRAGSASGRWRRPPAARRPGVAPRFLRPPPRGLAPSRLALGDPPDRVAGVSSCSRSPAAVYVALYLPWVALGNRLTATFPAGNTGQTLLDLTKSVM